MNKAQRFLFTEGGGFSKNPSVIAEEIEFVIVDLFAGAGGTTTGFDDAQLKGKKIAIVAAAVNHDWKAIRSHWQNHPEVIHFEEDIRSLELSPLVEIVAKYRQIYKNAKIILWASLECTNFSKAKGGLSRDPDSRTLAIHLPRYIEALDPDYIQIENVVEFRSWGPLRIKALKVHKAEPEKGIYWNTELKTGIDKNSKEECYWWTPISKLNGRDFKTWCAGIDAMGYTNEWKELNSADYGAYTSRNRLFGCFAKPGLPIIWPESTHAKKTPKKKNYTLFGDQPKEQWKAVKDLLDFEDEGESIFDRIRPVKTAKHAKKLLTTGKKVTKIYALPSRRETFIEGLQLTTANLDKFDALVEVYHAEHGPLDFYYYEDLADKSLERTYAGLIKFVAGMSKKAFLANYNSTGKDGNMKNAVRSLDEPAPVIPTSNRLYAYFVKHAFTGDVGWETMINPNPKSSFITQRQSGQPDSRLVDVDGPARALTSTAGNQDLNKVVFLLNYHGKSDAVSPEQPSPPILTRDKLALEQVNFVDGFLAKYYGTGGQLNSFDESCPTITSRENLSKMQLVWLQRPFGQGGGQHSSIDNPAGAITAGNPKLDKVTAQPFIMNTNYNNVGTSVNEPSGPLLASRRHYYLVNPSYYGHSHIVDEPCPVLIARQDKAPLYLVKVVYGNAFIPVYDDDSEVMKDIKVFMALYGISDIKMRMLKVSELLPIQGFPIDYHLYGNQSDQKKFIGNSVHPLIPKHWAEALGTRQRELRLMAA